MELLEFSSQFDILFNNIMSNQAPGLDEYEKSYFLTKAQLEVVKNYFNPKGNKYQEGFDGNQKRQIDFSMLMKTGVCSPVDTDGEDFNRIDDRSKLFVLPSDAMMIVNESITIQREESMRYLTVVPVSYDEYSRLMMKPYKLPLKSQAWRLVNSENEDELITAEVIGNFLEEDMIKYKVRYVKRPSPIILVDLDDMFANISIDGECKAMGCKLDKELHEEILQRAVEIAKVAYSGDVNASMSVGQRSE